MPFTAPEERIRAKIKFVKKNFAEAELVEVLDASPFRVSPPCPVAGVCGGCTWQHVDYDEQLRQKQNIVADAVRKFAKRGPISVLPTIASPNPFHYRNRIQLHYKNGQIGFFQKGSNQLAPIERCLITDNKLNEKIESLRSSLKSENSAPVRRELYITESGTAAIGSELRFEDELGFSQVNEPQNQNMLKYVSEHVGNPSLLFDLYAGAGNFAFRLASDHPEIKKVVAVELHPKSVEHGRKKAKALGRDQVHFVNSGVGEFLTEVLAGKNSLAKFQDFSEATVVLDPPRAGCEKPVPELLKKLAPKKIVYISCDPVTLARDLAEWPSELYSIESIQPFDMFPQTDHVETVVHLTRSL